MKIPELSSIVATVALILAGCGGPVAPRDAESASALASGPPSHEAPPASDDGQPSGLAAVFAAKSGDDGVVVTDVQMGEGASVREGDHAKVSYVGRLADGTVFESSKDSAPEVELVLGKGATLRALERGIVGMKTGGVRRITVPWASAYGEAGRPPRIPARADLVYEVELRDIPLPPGPPPPKPGDPGNVPPGGRRGRRAR